MQYYKEKDLKPAILAVQKLPLLEKELPYARLVRVKMALEYAQKNAVKYLGSVRQLQSLKEMALIV